VTVAALVAGQGSIASAQATSTTTIAPTTPQIAGSSFPFGTGATWVPHLVWVYKDIPAFQLKPGDSIGFDLQDVKLNVDIQVAIALAPTTVNGGDVEAAPFTDIVSNTQVPANPRGNTILGDYELQFTAQAPFSFPGGGLLIRISTPGGAYAADNSGPNTFNDSLGQASDPSGYFVGRRWFDPDGVSPWTGTNATDQVAPFQLRIADIVPAIAASTTGPAIAPAIAPTATTPKRKRCKKKRKQHAGAAVAKKCKKKRR
jgi:hypothetical protein